MKSALLFSFTLSTPPAFCQLELELLRKRTYFDGGDSCLPSVISETAVRSSIGTVIETTVEACDVHMISGPTGAFLRTYRFGPRSENSIYAKLEFASQIEMGSVRFEVFGDYRVTFNSLHDGSSDTASTFGEWFNETVSHDCQYFVDSGDGCNPDLLCNEIVNPFELCDEYWACQTGCPIILDTENDGFRFGGPDSAVFFDLYGEGDPDHLQWVVPDEDDAFLFMDLDGNGIADDGTELFGHGTRLIIQNESHSPNGFVALAQFDSPLLGGDDDGRISDRDRIWPLLSLWFDRNADGRCSPDEVIDPESAALQWIGCVPRESDQVDIHGNALRFFSIAKGNNGTRLPTADVFFKRIIENSP